jgi:thiamine-phosphate pyrophosphorylase
VLYDGQIFDLRYKLDLRFPAIYPITDTFISGLSHAEQVKRMIAGGARIIQLREKRKPAREFFEDASIAVDIGRSNDVIILINDRVDIAIAANAHGVHLGQSDLSPTHARRLLGNNRIIGYSTHNVEQALAAGELLVDYIAIGPVFSTNTKTNPDAAVGTEGVSQVRKAIGGKPLVAIGGIAFTAVNPVLEAGAHSVALISDLLKDPAKITSKLQSSLSD